MSLATAQKGTSTVAEYFGRMKTLADEMASADKKLDDKELSSYILAGLDLDFNPIVSAIATRSKPLTLGELYTQLVGFEQRLNLLQGGGSKSSANVAACGGRGNSHGRNGGRGGGRGRGRGTDRQGSNSGSNSERPTCQLCGREGHTVIRCYKRFDASFQGALEKSASAATTSSYNINTNCYTDSGASDHVTGELEKLTMRDRYQGGDQVHTASGAGMEIKQIGRSIVHAPNRDIFLNNVLYVPQANKISLLLIIIFFLSFIPTIFLSRTEQRRGFY